MPQSAQHGFRLFHPKNSTLAVIVSMPQSAQHGFRRRALERSTGAPVKFQCLNRHSMGSDLGLSSSKAHEWRGFNASIGTAWVQTWRSCLPSSWGAVSMPQSAQHGFRRFGDQSSESAACVSMPQSAQHGFRLISPPIPHPNRLSFNASIGTAWVQTADHIEYMPDEMQRQPTFSPKSHE